MILQIPFEFWIWGTKRGNRRTAQYDMWEIADLDIDVIDPSDATLAVSWDDRLPEGFVLSPEDRKLWGCHSIDGNAHTVLHDNSHWVRLLESEVSWKSDRGGFQPLTPENMMSHLEQEGSLQLFEINNFKAKQRRSVDAHFNDATGEFLEIRKSQRQTALHEMQKKAAKLAIVDGCLYQRLSPPVIEPFFIILKLEVSPTGSAPVALVKMITSYEGYDKDRTVGRGRYAVSEFDAALADAAEYNRASEAGASADKLNEVRRPLYVATSAFDHDVHMRRRLFDLHTKFNAPFMDVRLGEMTRTSLLKFVALDEARMSADTAEGMAAFEEAVIALHDDLDRPGQTHRDHIGPLREMMDILESRDVSIDISIPGISR